MAKNIDAMIREGWMDFGAAELVGYIIQCSFAVSGIDVLF
jgi:hypothetical protein